MRSTGLTNLNNFNYKEWSPELENICLAEYIWIDGSGKTLRSKTKVYHKKIEKLEDLDWWTFDGSSTMQASTGQSEIYVKPVFFCKDPIRRKNSILVLCETYLSDLKTPARYNFRYMCEKIMNEAKEHKPWFGMEQEYFLFTRTGTTHEWPLGWPFDGFPYPQGRYYCAIGDNNSFGRAMAESHLRCCLEAGLKIAGINAEVAPGQWEYQVGIAEGIECGDHHWMSRYILYRLGEEFNVTVNTDPKPVQGDWNGSGCHMNFSTEKTRGEGGLKYILEHCMKKMNAKHKEHIVLYGEGNIKRLTGHHETSSIDKFNYGEGSRAASCRIPIPTHINGKGYFEDRRPASNIDPYLATAILVDTVCLNSKYCDELIQAYKNSLENNF